MKLKNFMFATMIACAFASCSEDDVIDNGPDPVNGAASLKIDLGIKTTKGVITDGDTETTVNDINIFLCNSDGSVKSRVYLGADATIAADETVTFTDLSVGETLYCVGFANFGSEMTTIPEDAVINTTDNIGGTNLPMHGFSGDVEIKAGENTTDLVLTRDLARVELVGLSLDMKPENQTAFTAGTFKFDFISASVNSTPTSSTVTFATKAVERSYAVGANFVGGLAVANWDWNGVTNDSQSDSYIKSDADETFATYVMGTTTAPQTITKPASIVFYVLPNEATLDETDDTYSNTNPTAFTLNGKMVVENGVRDGQTINNTYDSFYNIEIGKDGTVTGQTKGAGVLPNKNYKITLTVAGIGEGEGGVRPYLVVNTVVEDWDVVEQSAVVK